MNNSVREEIEKAALKRIEEQHFLGLDGRYKTAYLLGATWGATFGYNLALKHCQVLREALELALSFCPKGEVPKDLAPMFYHTLNYEDEVKLQERIDKAREALEQFDKITKEEK